MLTYLASEFPIRSGKIQQVCLENALANAYADIMFPASSIVKQVQNDDENNRFYAQAEVMLAEDLDHAELQLRDLDSSVYAAPLMNAKAGVNTFYISGSGNSPFKIGGIVPVICFPKGEIP